MANLGSNFYSKLAQMCAKYGMNPQDLLLVMTLESGLDPSAGNPAGGASGLIQMMPFILKNVGFTGSPADFRKLSGEDQLEYVEKYLSRMTKLNGGSFKSAVEYYIANFFPAALHLPGVKQKDPNTVIIDSQASTSHYKGISPEFERKVYQQNKGLDANHDGKITYGDLETILNSKRKNVNFNEGVSQLNRLDVSPMFNTPSEDRTSNNLDEILNSYLTILGQETTTSKIVKNAELQQLNKEMQILRHNFIKSIK